MSGLLHNSCCNYNFSKVVSYTGFSSRFVFIFTASRRYSLLCWCTVISMYEYVTMFLSLLICTVCTYSKRKPCLTMGQNLVPSPPPLLEVDYTVVRRAKRFAYRSVSDVVSFRSAPSTWSPASGVKVSDITYGKFCSA